MGRFDKLREEKGGLAQRFNFSISCNKKEKVAPCKKGTLKVANLARSTFSILLNDQKLHSPLKNWTWHCHRPGPGSLRRWIGLWRDGGWGWCYVWVGCRWCLGWWWCWLASSLLPRSAKRLQPAHTASAQSRLRLAWEWAEGSGVSEWVRVSWQIFPGCRFFRQLRKRGLHLGRVTSGPNSQPVSLTQKALSDPEQCQNCIKRSATESR